MEEPCCLRIGDGEEDETSCFRILELDEVEIRGRRI